MGLCRSLLYVPANRPELIAKIERFEADVYILDLEDGVPASEKEKARSIIDEVAPRHVKAGRVLHIRVNPVHTPWHRADIEAAMGLGISRIHIPKLASVEDMKDADHRVLELSVKWGMKLEDIELFPTIETSRALLDADSICGASKHIAGVLVGGDDLTAEWGIVRSTEGREVELARQTVVVVANAHDAAPIDATYPFHKDLEGCARDARHARELGFQGKQAIHPAQCPVINEAFTPTEKEVERAKSILAAAAAAEAEGQGTAAAGGTQIDAAVAKSARRLLDWADRIAGTES